MALTFNAASSTPNSGNTAVPLNAYIKLVFNSEVQSAYFSPTAVGTYFQLYKEAGFVKYGVIAGRTVDNNLAIYLLPMAKLEPNTKYTLIIVGGTNGIKNIANETLTGNQVISFTTTYFADNQISINITDSVVTFPPVAQEPVPIPTPPGSVVNFQDVNNLVGSESGIAEFYYEDGSQIGQIFIEHSNPEEFTIGNIDFYQFVSYWNEDIRSRYADEIKITKAKLPFDTVNFLGNWAFIEQLIHDCWIRLGIPVSVYYLPGTLPEVENRNRTPALSLKDACTTILGGVGAMSPELYGGALQKIAEMTGRTVDEQFKSEVTECLKTLPCPLD